MLQVVADQLHSSNYLRACAACRAASFRRLCLKNFCLDPARTNCAGEARATGWLLSVLFYGGYDQRFASCGSLPVHTEWLHHIRQLQPDWQSAEGMRGLVVSCSERGHHSRSRNEGLAPEV